MEPPAVTSCGVGSHSSSNSGSGNIQQHGQTPKYFLFLILFINCLSILY